MGSIKATTALIRIDKKKSRPHKQSAQKSYTKRNYSNATV